MAVTLSAFSQMSYVYEWVVWMWSDQLVFGRLLYLEEAGRMANMTEAVSLSAAPTHLLSHQPITAYLSLFHLELHQFILIPVALYTFRHTLFGWKGMGLGALVMILLRYVTEMNVGMYIYIESIV